AILAPTNDGIKGRIDCTVMYGEHRCIHASQPGNHIPIRMTSGSLRTASSLDKTPHIGIEGVGIVGREDWGQSHRAIGVDLALEGFHCGKFRHFTSCSLLFDPSVQGGGRAKRSALMK